MRACSFGRLLQFINGRLDLDGQLELYDHIDRCAICRDAVCELLSERRVFYVYRAHRCEPYGDLPHRISTAAGSPAP